MSHVLCPHWIPQHYHERDRNVLRRWQPRAIKIVWTGAPAHLDAALAAQPELVVVRDYALSEQKAGAPVALGTAHADAIGQMTNGIRAQHPHADLTRFAFEGVNEPELWGQNPPTWVAQYEAARLKRMHQLGLRAVVGNLNVGWPGDYGQPDSAVNWEPFAPMFAAMRNTDFLGVHEYWSPSGPQDNWLWWAGRYLHLPHDVPILLTECGLDDAVRTGQHKGWQHLDGQPEVQAQTYVAQLRWYADQLRRDRRIYAAFIFTHDHQDEQWQAFNTRDDAFLAAFLEEAGPQAAVWGDYRTWRWQWLCERHGAEYGIDPRIVAAVLALESGGRVDAISSAGAVGLMQVMPAEKIPGRPQMVLLKNPDVNVRWGCRILRASVDAFNGSLAHGLAAYYMGVDGVRQKGLRHTDAQQYLAAFASTWRELWGSPPPGDVASALHDASAPLPTDTVAIRWHAEEAVREIEAAQDRLAAARQRLLDQVIAPLYRLEQEH